MSEDATDERETIEPLLGDSRAERTRQRAAGIGAVVGAVVGSRRGVLAAGITAGLGGAVGYVAGSLLTGDESVPVETDPVDIDIGDDE